MSGAALPLHTQTLTPDARLGAQERKLFDERFIRLDTRRLCELTSAADALGMKSLVDLTSRALARMIEGKTPEEIRETFHLPDDLTGAHAARPRMPLFAWPDSARVCGALQRRRSWSQCAPPRTTRGYGS